MNHEHRESYDDSRTAGAYDLWSDAQQDVEEDRRRIARALAWIVGALRRHGVPHQAVGGLAARAYGARRPLNDIDFYVPFNRAAGVLEEVRPFVVWGPEHHAGDEWDLTYLKIDYHGQRIELGDSSTTPATSMVPPTEGRSSGSTTGGPSPCGCMGSRSRLCQETS